MEDKGISREVLNENERVRLSYHAPELIKLGPIQSMVQNGTLSGGDARSATTALS